MKRTERETKYEHESTIIVVKEMASDSKAPETGGVRVGIYKRAPGEDRGASQWTGNLQQLADMREAIDLVVAEHPGFAGPGFAAGFRLIQPTLNGASAGAQPPTPDPGRMILQVSLDDIAAVSKVANAIIEDAEALRRVGTPHLTSRALHLATMVNRMLSGTSAAEGQEVTRTEDMHGGEP